MNLGKGQSLDTRYQSKERYKINSLKSQRVGVKTIFFNDVLQFGIHHIWQRQIDQFDSGRKLGDTLQKETIASREG